MEASTVIRTARQRARLSLRDLAERAGTSHGTIAAYEAGRKVPTVDTLDRVIKAAGYDPEVVLQRRVGIGEPRARGDELAEVLELAARFPARHRRTLAYPRFGA